MLRHAAELAEASRPLDPGRYPHLPRGPPGVAVRVVPAEARRPRTDGVVAFGWRHPVTAPDGVVMAFADTLAEIEAHVHAGRLATDWWARLLAHELAFHLVASEHTGHRHEAHADGLAGELLMARALLPQQRAVRAVLARFAEAWEDVRRHELAASSASTIDPVRAVGSGSATTSPR